MPSHAVLLTLLAAATLAAQTPIRPRPGDERYPPYTPATRATFTPARLLAAQARWLRNQVWATGPVADAATFLLPRSYDVTSGYGFLGTDYFSWLLAHDGAYFRFDASHNDHRLDVPPDSSNDAPIERVLMAWGSDAYDAAAWGVAMAAATGCAGFSREEGADFTAALNAYLKVLVTASYPGGFQSYRAWDPSGSRRWHYGESGEDAARGTDGQGGSLDARNAFLWQFSSPRWQNPDPCWDPLAPAGALMNWPGWNVIMGEEAWAVFLGPLQAAYTLNQGRPGWSMASTPIPVPALVENACRALHGVELMRNSATGGVYRQVQPPEGPGDPRASISLENNWSLYAGLGFLERALEDLKATLPRASQVPDVDPDRALATVRRLRAGLRSFFLDRDRVWHARGAPFGDPAAVPYGFFLQGTTGLAGAAAGVTSAFATDVQTWGIAAILADPELLRAITGAYGEDCLYDMFQAAIHLGGYHVQGPDGPVLAGIGFNAQRPGAPEAQLSGEWTWGAINAAILLADHYREPARADPGRVAELLRDARLMIDGVTRLASHDYNPLRLKDGRDWVGTLYANRRRWVPWGWYSNACPSQAATAWAFMVNAGFNPFEPAGGRHQPTAKELGLAGSFNCPGGPGRDTSFGPG